MPLERLSIKSALKLAQRSVTMHRRGDTGDRWFVRARFPNVATNTSTPQPRAKTRQLLHSTRVYAALVAMGVPSTEAHALASASGRGGEWRSDVSTIMEKRELCAPKSHTAREE